MEKKTFIAYCNCLPVIQSTQYIKKKFVIILERSKEKKLKKKKKMSVYSTLKHFVYKYNYLFIFQSKYKDKNIKMRLHDHL